MSNMSPIMKAIGDRIVEQTKKRFESGGPSPQGRRWAKSKTPNPKRIRTLTVTGHLRDSIRPQMIGNNGVAIGTNRVYAAIHQFGGPAGRGLKADIPARPYLGLSKKDSDEIIGMINEFVMRSK